MFQPGTRFACRSGWLLCTPLSSTATTMPAPVEVVQAVEAPILEICHSCGRIGSFVTPVADKMRSTSANFTWGLRASALATASSFALAGNSTTCTSSPRTLPSDLPLWDIRTPAKSSSESPALGATRMRLFAQLPHGERSIAADGNVAESRVAACATFATGDAGDERRRDDEAGKTEESRLEYVGFHAAPFSQSKHGWTAAWMASSGCEDVQASNSGVETSREHDAPRSNRTGSPAVMGPIAL